MKPPFSYYGGKQRTASKIIPFIPKHTVYVEPFCGSATILFKKPWPDVTNTTHYREYINDRNELVINFFKVLATKGEELADRLACYPMSESMYKKAVGLCKNSDGHSEIELAEAFFINIQQSFSGKLNGGWRRSVVSRNEQATWEKAKNLYPYIARMQSVGISCQDAATSIKQFDSPQTFFYCDPPYPETDQGHYGGYTINDLKHLIDTLELSKGRLLLAVMSSMICLIRLYGPKRHLTPIARLPVKGRLGQIDQKRLRT